MVPAEKIPFGVDELKCLLNEHGLSIIRHSPTLDPSQAQWAPVCLR